MFRKKEVYTNVTPIPSHIPRQLAIDILHSHAEIITLNPLVIEHEPIKAPRDAVADEYYATWYEITERIQYLPGMGKMGSGKLSFKGCFHDMPWGLQTHIYTPMNIDIRNNWRIAGNQPGEPPETREMGISAPVDGLYLREDIEIKANVTLVSFVKAQLKASSKILVDRLIKKAELLDAGVLHAMMEDGKLKTINPADRSNSVRSPNNNQYRPMSMLPQQAQRPPSPYSHAAQSDPQEPAQIIMELPGDFVHPNASYGGSPHLNPSGPPGINRFSSVSKLSQHSDGSPNPNTGRWSDASSRPTSYASEPMRSPRPDQQVFAQELPAHTETREEYNPAQGGALKTLEARGSLYRPPPPQQQQQRESRPRYDPRDYADLNPQRDSSQPRVVWP